MISRLISAFLVIISLFTYYFNFNVSPDSSSYTITDYKVAKNMDKYRGVSSYVKEYNGIPTLFINDEPYPAAAYMTYLEDRNCYDDFSSAGYSLFSFPTLFAGRWINSTVKNMKPFSKGIFDVKDEPDFSFFDSSIKSILSVCPDAFIFPRVNLSMPIWWIEEHPDCLDGTVERESLLSDVWLKDVSEMLKTFIEHVNESDYASHIAAYQLAGGNTEEWFHFDLNGGVSSCAEKGFERFLKEHYPEITFKGLPDLTLLSKNQVYHKSEYLARYLEYSSFQIAEDIAFLASVAKEATGGNIAIGTFYGYSLEVTEPLYGTHALKHLLKSDNIDYICSPNSYIGVRDINSDFTEMYPADSVRLHGKLCMQECDIRTNHTKYLYECAPETDPDKNYVSDIWKACADRETAISQIRKSFGRQLVKGNGFWWFDMWGGWYKDDVIMSEMEKYRQIYASSLSSGDRSSVSQVAVFVDEDIYKHMTACGRRNAVYNQRKQLGLMGAPYDIYDISDFDAVYNKYKAVIFLSDMKSSPLKSAVSSCRKEKIPFLMNSNAKKEFSADELRAFLKSCGVHLYCNTADIVYVNNDYLVIHSSSEGEKTIYFSKDVILTQLLGDDSKYTGKEISIEMNENETLIFSVAECL